MWALVQSIENQMYNVMVAFLILFIGLIFGIISQKIIVKILNNFSLDLMLKKKGKTYSLEKLISQIIAGIIYFITAILFLNQLKVTNILAYALLGLILLIISVIIILGIKNIIPNLIVGMKKSHQKKWLPGKIIKINGVEGKIEKNGWTEVIIRTKEGKKIYIPNSLISKH